MATTTEAKASRTGARAEASAPESTAERRPAPPLLDPRVFGDALLDHHDVAYSVAFRILGSREAAEDATQEAYLHAFAARERFIGGSLRAWLLRIVANAAIDEWRRAKRRRHQVISSMTRDTEDARPHAYEPADPAPDPAAVAEQHDLGRTLEAALDQLSADFRRAVILRDVHGCTYDEIAQMAGVPIGTVRSRLCRARRQLRVILRDLDERGPAQRRAS